ncbi:hypothetical protein N7533_001538 [Penicillium manginii]|uniref:uncharacterized protein n=1 Tax=Penicillium manginii TaxID=203109 RepID=UPI002546F6BF|nr:uncharacterized protein N7533_001538 [Penicillium manginii]KAJ5762857.1 hypothetical protein N7533_001538 [Penicillium manginii]
MSGDGALHTPYSAPLGPRTHEHLQYSGPKPEPETFDSAPKHPATQTAESSLKFVYPRIGCALMQLIRRDREILGELSDSPSNPRHGTENK